MSMGCCQIVGLLFGLLAVVLGIQLQRRSNALRVTQRNLSNRVFLITGATSGLGRWHAERLLGMNATVVLAARNLSKAHAVAAEMRRSVGDASSGTVQVAEQQLDLASLTSVRAFARYWEEKHDDLHVLVNNAAELGLKGGEGGPRITSDGFERCFQINYLSHYLLTELLLPSLKRSAPARVVHVSATAHRNHWAQLDFSKDAQIKDNTEYDARASSSMGNLVGTYGDSKLYQIMYSQYLGRELEGTGVVSHSLHPAIVGTNLMSTATADGSHNTLSNKVLQSVFLNIIGRIIGMTHTEEQAVMTQLHVSIAPELADSPPRYYTPDAAPLENCRRPADECGSEKPSKIASDETLQQELVELSRRLVRQDGQLDEK